MNDSSVMGLLVVLFEIWFPMVLCCLDCPAKSLRGNDSDGGSGGQGGFQLQYDSIDVPG